MAARLFTAAAIGDVKLIEDLVQTGSESTDTPDEKGWTPLFAAAWNGHVSAIETLVGLGSKAIDTPNNYDWTPMYAAASNPYINEDLPKVVQVITVLKYFGGSTNISFKDVPPAVIEIGKRSLTEDEVAALRYRLHFAESLVNRLLFQLFESPDDPRPLSSEQSSSSSAAASKHRKCVLC